jgi:hypothetical protein
MSVLLSSDALQKLPLDGITVIDMSRALRSVLHHGLGGILHELRRVPITVQTPRNRSVGRARRVLKITERFP